MQDSIRCTAIAGAAMVAALPLLVMTASCRTYGGRPGEPAAAAPSPPAEQRPRESRSGRETAALERGEPSGVDEVRPPGKPPFTEEPGLAIPEEGKLGRKPADGKADGSHARERAVPGAGVAEPGRAEAAPPAGDGSSAGGASALAASTSLVDAAVQSLEWGTIVFNVPSQMRYQERYVVELVLSMTASRAELQAELETGAGAGAQSAEIRISNEMEARLTGTGFTFKRIEPASQAVSRLATTRWRWEVIPEERGTRVLHLALYAHIRIAGSDKRYVVRTFDRTINVQITMPQRVTGFVFENWQWLWAALLLPTAGYLWKRRKDHGGPRPESHAI